MDEHDIKSTEDREYFRINDMVEFAYCPLSNDPNADQECLKQLFTTDSYEHFQLMQEWQDIERQGRDLLSSIIRKIPELSEYLALMNKKYEGLAHHLFHAYQRETCQINLSAGGLAFESSEPLNEGTTLKVKLIFRPNFYGIITDVKVVHVRHLPKRNSKMPYMIAVEFINLTIDQQRLINQHIISLQVKQIRKQEPS